MIQQFFILLISYSLIGCGKNETSDKILRNAKITENRHAKYFYNSKGEMKFPEKKYDPKRKNNKTNVQYPWPCTCQPIMRDGQTPCEKDGHNFFCRGKTKQPFFNLAWLEDKWHHDYFLGSDGYDYSGESLGGTTESPPYSTSFSKCPINYNETYKVKKKSSPFKNMDKKSLLRGLQVYLELAYAHGIRNIYFSDFSHKKYGFMSREKAKELASEFDCSYPNDKKCTIDDAFPSPYSSYKEGVEINNGAFPVDFSFIGRDRYNDHNPFNKSLGCNYIYKFLMGKIIPYVGDVGEEGVWREFTKIPDDAFERNDYGYPWFPTKCSKERGVGVGVGRENIGVGSDYIGNPNYSCNKEKINISNASACPIKISEGDVVYNDGTRATKEQIAKDLNLFLIWVAHVSEKRCQENNGTKCLPPVYLEKQNQCIPLHPENSNWTNSC